MTVIVFKLTQTIAERRLLKLANQHARFIYWITSGFEFLGQISEVREHFEKGYIEL